MPRSPAARLSLRILQFLIRRFKGGRDAFQIAIYAHQLLEDVDALLSRLVHGPLGLLTLPIGFQLCVGEQLLAGLFGVGTPGEWQVSRAGVRYRFHSYQRA